jgi:four helix bundle protein
MTYTRFEELPVWNEAVRLFEEMDDFLESAPPRLRYAFRDQLERATLSVSNNIAEGFERGTTNELLNFIYIARGSAAEVRSMLCILERRRWMKEFSKLIAALKSVAESCSRQLRAWADSLQNSDIKGQRHLNNSVRKSNDRKEAGLDLRKEFLRRLPDTDARKKAAIERGELP